MEYFHSNTEQLEKTFKDFVKGKGLGHWHIGLGYRISSHKDFSANLSFEFYNKETKDREYHLFPIGFNKKLDYLELRPAIKKVVKEFVTPNDIFALVRKLYKDYNADFSIYTK